VIDNLIVFDRAWNSNDRGLVSVIESLPDGEEHLIVCRGKVNDLHKFTVLENTFGFENRYIGAILTHAYSPFSFLYFFWLVIRYKPSTVYLREVRYLHFFSFFKALGFNLFIKLDVRENVETNFNYSLIYFKICLCFVDQFFTNSIGLKRFYEDRYKIEKIQLRYALPASRFFSGFDEIKSGSLVRSNDVVKLVFFGDIKEDRLLHDFIDSLRSIDSGWKFDIFGKCRDRQYFDKLTKKALGLPIIFNGEMSYSGASGKLANYDVGVMFNDVNQNSRYTIPGKLWEYLASGLPVITNTRDSLNSFDVGSFGWVCDDFDEVSRVLQSILLDRKKIKEKITGVRIFYKTIVEMVEGQKYF